jgi:hypothetical protein
MAGTHQHSPSVRNCSTRSLSLILCRGQGRSKLIHRFGIDGIAEEQNLAYTVAQMVRNRMFGVKREYSFVPKLWSNRNACLKINSPEREHL